MRAVARLCHRWSTEDRHDGAPLVPFASSKDFLFCEGKFRISSALMAVLIEPVRHEAVFSLRPIHGAYFTSSRVLKLSKRFNFSTEKITTVGWIGTWTSFPRSIVPREK